MTNYPVRKYISILISNTVNKPTSNIYFVKLFENIILDWSKTYLSPHLAIIDTTLRSFQYEILNNILFFNKNLYTFGITNTALCSFCSTLEETSIHIFSLTAFILNVFGKNYGPNFWTILSCHHFPHRLPFLNYIMKQTIIIIFFWVGGKGIFCLFICLYVCFNIFIYFFMSCFILL